ncbi:GDP-mannose 4,6-dehydratase [Mycobacterium kiyosense]|nr:hypothetical protein IWGMT90018_34540 [Mycobacterium kiyosense]
MHYLITGHTGFKGPWLVLLLLSRGHQVSGLALNPDDGSLFQRAGLTEHLVSDFRVDIRDAEATAAAVKAAAPDVVVHMAAQSLVRESYRNPRYTYETNAIGTLNVLEAVGATPLGARTRGHYDRQGLPQRRSGGRIRRNRPPRR